VFCKDKINNMADNLAHLGDELIAAINKYETSISIARQYCGRAPTKENVEMLAISMHNFIIARDHLAKITSQADDACEQYWAEDVSARD
jgi:hypothetical protein